MPMFEQHWVQSLSFEKSATDEHFAAIAAGIAADDVRVDVVADIADATAAAAAAG